MDFFIDRLYKSVINEHLKRYDKKTQEQLDLDHLLIWKATTRNLLLKHSTDDLYRLFEEAIEEATDYEYFERKVFAKLKSDLKKQEDSFQYRMNNKIKNELMNRIKITDIAKQFGHQPDSKGRILCPFHADGDPSCYLNDEKGIFKCFGCNAKGDIIEFYRRLQSG